MSSCAQKNRACAAVCGTSAQLMSMDSQFAKQFCNVCASNCDACALGNITATIEGARRMSEEWKTKTKVLRRWIHVSIYVDYARPIGYFFGKPISNEHLSIIIGFAAGDLIAFILEHLYLKHIRKMNWITRYQRDLGFWLEWQFFIFYVINQLDPHIILHSIS